MSQIIQALQALKSRCDGANKKDDVGFNSVDTWTASDILTLANAKKEISPDVEWLAWDILRKYKVQLSNIGFDWDSFDEPKTTKSKEEIKNSSKSTASEIKDKVKVEARSAEAIENFRVSVVPEGIICQFTYSEVVVGAIKAVPKARYQPDNKAWLVPYATESLKALESLLGRFGVKFGQDVSDIFNKAESYTVVNRAELRDDNRIEFKFDFDLKLVSAIKLIEGARWNAMSKFWSIPLTVQNYTTVAYFISNYGFLASDDVVGAIARYKDRSENNLAGSMKQESTLVVKGVTGELRPFQKAGVEYLTKNKYVLLADEQGTGKTPQTICALEHNLAYPAIVVCPASLQLNWRQEIRKWIPHRKVVIFDGKEFPNSYDILILNYEKMKKIPENTAKLAIVFDECHRLKNHKAKCTILATELSKNTKFRFLLSGTPMLNRPQELISQLTILNKLDDFGGFWKFANKFCDAKKTKYGYDLSGASNLEELKIALRKVCLIRREKADVLPELPAKQRSHIPVEISNRREYTKAEADFIHFYKERAKNDEKFRKELFAQKLSKEETAEAIRKRSESEAAKAERAEQLVKINTLRKLAAEGKIEQAYEWLTDFIETGKQLVVFVQHKDILYRVKELLTKDGVKVVTICGDDKNEMRQQSINDFQAGKAQVIICTLKTGGEGITLTAASDVCFIEVGWKPAEMDQAEDRLHRIGQRESVNCWYLKSDNTIDDMIYDLIEHKRQVTNIDKNASLMDEIISKLIK